MRFLQRYGRLAWLAIPLLTGSCTPPQQADLAIVGVTIVDVTDGSLKPNQTVLVDGNRITLVGPAEETRVSDEADVVDAAAKYLIPGLWDMHTHVFSNVSRPGTDLSDWAFPLYVANGVTGVRDMWTDPEDIAVARGWNEARASGTLLAPYVEWSSDVVNGVSQRPNQVGVDTPEEARRVVRELEAGGAGFIKVYWELRSEVFLAIAEEARQLGIPFAGHVPWDVDAFDASDAGIKSIEHLTGVKDACEVWSDELQDDVFDETIFVDLVATYARNGTWQVPTLVLYESLDLRDAPGLITDPSLRYVPESEKETWGIDWDDESSTLPDGHREERAFWLRIVGDMHRGGVPILAGTDVGNPLIVPGFGVHVELELMVEAGLSPAAALRTATSNVGDYFGRADIGTIEPGSIADLVLLDADPTSDIRNTRGIAAVVLNGRYLDRTALDDLLAKRRQD